MTIEGLVKKLKKAISYGFYDGKKLGCYENDFKKLDTFIKKAKKNDKVLGIFKEHLEIVEREIDYCSLLSYEINCFNSELDDEEHEILKEWQEGE